MKQYKRVCAKIDLDAVLFNMESMHQNINPETKMMAVIKTDAYGHGAVQIAHTIEKLDYLFGFAVATVEEGVELRKSGIQKPILILGYVFPEQYETIVTYQIRTSVCTYEMAKELSDTAETLNMDYPIHIILDTGMSRLGFQITEESAQTIAQIAKLPHIIMEGIFTHFAKADEKEKDNTFLQIAKFEKMLSWLEKRQVTFQYRHCSNSAGIIEIPKANFDMVRAGITLYGLWPSSEVRQDIVALKPVLSLKSHVAFLKKLESGRSISYGGTYTTPKEEIIATIPVGYGDGYARGLSNKGYVLIHGKKAPIRGRICMDQFMVDVTGIEHVSVGDEVTLIGTDGDLSITLEELGELSGRFNYEFACLLGRRIPRVFYQNGVETGVEDYFIK